MSTKWYRGGSGERITFDEILEIIREHADSGGHVAIGTDSSIRKRSCTFSTAICLYGADDQSGGYYFVNRFVDSKKNYPALIVRIMNEARSSIDTAQRIMEIHPNIELEIHIDVSHADKGTKTSAFSDSLVGYAVGSGFKCKIKPNAFVASSIADKHSK